MVIVVGARRHLGDVTTKTIVIGRDVIVCGSRHRLRSRCRRRSHSCECRAVVVCGSKIFFEGALVVIAIVAAFDVRAVRLHFFPKRQTP